MGPMPRPNASVDVESFAMVKDGAGTLTLSGTSLLDWTVDQGGIISAAER
ncbi:MAG: hypothetical protein E5Y34_10700 [Mesorhizobium sp.]|nr:MAG: hypothetical protein E5Y34_10700 [Mesorhizobium sp.]